MKKYFIVYELIFDKNGNIIDFENKYDSDKLKDIAKWLDIDYSNIYKYVSTQAYESDIIDLVLKNRLKDNKYFILKDYE